MTFLRFTYSAQRFYTKLKKNYYRHASLMSYARGNAVPVIECAIFLLRAGSIMSAVFRWDQRCSFSRLAHQTQVSTHSCASSPYNSTKLNTSVICKRRLYPSHTRDKGTLYKGTFRPSSRKQRLPFSFPLTKLLRRLVTRVAAAFEEFT